MVTQEDRPDIAGVSAVTVVIKACEEILLLPRCSLRGKFMLSTGLIDDGVIKKASTNNIH